MNIETLFGRLLRRLSQRLMVFPNVSDSTMLPAADPSRHYLLYLHVPYCISLCPFCSFHRVKFERNSASRYFGCLRREIALHEEKGYRFDELYFGGGTPTVLPDELCRTIGELRERHPVTGISVETNPDHLQSVAVRRLADAGVTRLSVGVQSFDDTLLKAMQRYHAYGSGSQIVERLQQVRGVFETVNVDMIFNLPAQTEASLRRDLDILVDEIAADQVSFYPLMSSDTTRDRMNRTMGGVESTNEHKFYRLIVERMLEAGYIRSSAWCFSRERGMYDEYIADRSEYIGLGSGAFSYIQGSFYASTFAISHYMQMVESGNSGTVSRRALSERDRMRYYLLMRLFTGALDKTQAEREFDGGFQHKLWPELTALQSARAIRENAESLELTERGYYLWVVLMREFFGGINALREDVRHNINRERPALSATE